MALPDNTYTGEPRYIGAMTVAVCTEVKAKAGDHGARQTCIGVKASPIAWQLCLQSISITGETPESKPPDLSHEGLPSFYLVDGNRVGSEDFTSGHKRPCICKKGDDISPLSIHDSLKDSNTRSRFRGAQTWLVRPQLIAFPAATIWSARR